MNFVRGSMGQRNQNYDAPATTYRSSHSTPQTASIRDDTMNPNKMEAPQSIRRTRCPFLFDHNARRLYLLQILNLHVWKAFMICFTTILLFGAQIRDLFFPKSADLAVDIVFLIVVCFFWVDTLFRMDCETNYFRFYLFSSFGYSSGRTVPPRISDVRDVDPSVGYCCGRPFHIGSFLFWCDIISTVALLREITLLDPTGIFDEARIEIRLDQFGMPLDVSGLGHVNEASPLEYNAWDLLAIIGKTARVARFIRSSTAVKLASRINWFKISNAINPLTWCCRRKAAPTDVKVNKRVDILDRRASWTQAILQTQMQQRPITAESTSLRGGLTKVLRTLGIRKDNKHEFHRQMAATKIQRAWRRCRAMNNVDPEGHENHGYDDMAWKGRGASSATRISKKSNTGRSGTSTNGTVSDPVNRGSERISDRRIRNESQVGTAMRQLTGQRVAIGIIVALVITVLLTYQEISAVAATTMIVLHSQTANALFAEKALYAAKSSSVDNLFKYYLANGQMVEFPLNDGDVDPANLRDSETLRITVTDTAGNMTVGLLSIRDEIREQAVVSILATIFVLLVWFFGVTSFAGPVMILVVIPIERMVRLLTMLMLDPLGYQNTSRYKRFVAEEDEITKNTHWTKEVLKGMETSFLMSTILRIGSLMKVGFGSAGVEIIRRNLERGQNKNSVMLSNQGSTVSCIFLFSDIRQFTDATECLQEEVFVFTNRIAAVVHSICHSYGGSANKNIGDAFLLSWILDEDTGQSSELYPGRSEKFSAKHNQADKALLSVVKICMALYHDDYYVETMSSYARDALLAKIATRKTKGPIVQMGFGLHAGTAVQGAIGSTRKIDATYVSEAVERAEFLESSTKKYGLKMLMSDAFHKLLTPNQRRRCRKIDQIIIRNDDDDDEESELPEGDIVELLTFDMDIDALWVDAKQGAKAPKSDADSEAGSDRGSKRDIFSKSSQGLRQASGALMKRRRSIIMGIGGGKDFGSDELSDGGLTPGLGGVQLPTEQEKEAFKPPELVLPTGPALYNPSVWTDPVMKKMRKEFTDGLFFQNFNNGLQAYYSKDWDYAKQCFANVLDRYEDGPSRYFFEEIKKHNGVPPRNFLPYGVSD
ncbi:hypothetical protein FisN_10Hh123 [Fistulifera solaris]|uniref:Guanylate cyclase domain-containing protein n=1 Tax=Fistulifera solaris TaxID=1519565 RepID=A0A1Z5JXD6_FISSO|nr:hypothetical protein FisN_10Hh123 [Fistulifera solaris]|eukprot:GAX18664.1 hypothetical protein FisN_10Hh123 [Fistulifera solaris]